MKLPMKFDVVLGKMKDAEPNLFIKFLGFVFAPFDVMSLILIVLIAGFTILSE